MNNKPILNTKRNNTVSAIAIVVGIIICIAYLLFIFASDPRFDADNTSKNKETVSQEDTTQKCVVDNKFAQRGKYYISSNNCDTMTSNKSVFDDVEVGKEYEFTVSGEDNFIIMMPEQ